ncbi:MAG TPA: response regulator transcription factor [Puia sp.]|nr:response regulator transcription factor [Puia sp.]
MKKLNSAVKVGVVDDHGLFRNAIATLIKSKPEKYRVVIEAENGMDLIEKLSKLKTEDLPNVLTLDINMPEMDGFQTAEWLTVKQPQIKFIALSMFNDKNRIYRMIKNGAKGYITKNASSDEIYEAIDVVANNGVYINDSVSQKLFDAIKEYDADQFSKFLLDKRELQFLQLIVSEDTYKEISIKMNLSERTIDGIRNELFEKLNVKSRVGLVLYSIKKGIVNITH